MPDSTILFNIFLHGFQYCLHIQKYRILIPRTYEYITLHDKRDFADVMKLRLLRWGHFLGCLGGLNNVTSRGLIRGWQKDQSQ